MIALKICPSPHPVPPNTYGGVTKNKRGRRKKIVKIGVKEI